MRQEYRLPRGLLIALASVCAAAVNLGPVRAEPTEKVGTFTILFENDVFYRTDRDYTNGIQLAWTSPKLTSDDWAVHLADKLPFFSHTKDVRETVALGQDIFTPSNIALKNPPLTDHPYAGYLYVALGLLGKNADAPGAPTARLDQLQLQLGIVGPWSLAEETQKFVHSIINATNPEGWHTQLHNEPGIVLTYERSWRFSKMLFWRIGVDADPHIGAALGNVYTYADAGAMARLGIDLPDDFGPPRVNPGLPGSYYFEPQKEGEFGAYAFVGVDGRAMAHNIFLDGNTFQSSRHVDKNTLVGDLDYGAAVTWGRLRLTYTHTFRTREFKTQKGADQFGAVSVSLRI